MRPTRYEMCQLTCDMSLPVLNNKTLWSIPETPMYEFGFDSKLMSTEVSGSASSRLMSTLICKQRKPDNHLIDKYGEVSHKHRAI